MKLFETKRLILRNWQDRDRELFRRINVDDTVMEFFPFRRNAVSADELMDRIAAGIGQNGFGFGAIEIKATGETAGFAGLHLTDDIPNLPKNSTEIGWRLAPEFWGQGIASEAARGWLAQGFGPLGLHRIVSFAVASNTRSTAVMKRIGMIRRAELDFDHPKVPDTHPHLKRHSFYDLTAREYLQQLKAD